jgi:hypothetical protein
MFLSTEESQESRWPGRLAIGIVRGDPPDVYLASSVAVLGRVLALKVVAATGPETFRRHGNLDQVRTALLEERWADAVMLWIEATGVPIDGYPDESVWTNERLDAESTTFELRLTPVFEGPRE